MRYQHKFVVDATLDDVAAFHRRSNSMKRITPPPIVVRIHSAPEELGDGDEMSFTLWMGPLPMRWRARIENVTQTGFTDRQLNGPFGSWVHRHIFVPEDEGRTAVIDVVEAQPSQSLRWRIPGMGMWLGMPLLFAYRGWKTRRVLRKFEHRSEATESFSG